MLIEMCPSVETWSLALLSSPSGSGSGSGSTCGSGPGSGPGEGVGSSASPPMVPDAASTTASGSGSDFLLASLRIRTRGLAGLGSLLLFLCFQALAPVGLPVVVAAPSPASFPLVAADSFSRTSMASNASCAVTVAYTRPFLKTVRRMKSSSSSTSSRTPS